MEALNLKMVTSKLDELKPVENDSYLEVYSALQEFCERQVIKDQATLIGLAHMVYGWMPTILTFNTNLLVNEHVFEKISRGCLEVDFLTELKQTINNSIVGVSKLLHFLNNKDYAIWDSRVYQSITGKKAYEYRVNTVDIYIEYINKIRLISKELDEEYVMHELEIKGYCKKNISKLRIIELILFYTSA